MPLGSLLDDIGVSYLLNWPAALPPDLFCPFTRFSV
jgi:hypothetical protein